MFIIGIIFASIAGLAAFLITYGEYEHHYTSKKMPIKLSLQAALLAFSFFAILVWLVNRFVKF